MGKNKNNTNDWPLIKHSQKKKTMTNGLTQDNKKCE